MRVRPARPRLRRAAAVLTVLGVLTTSAVAADAAGASARDGSDSAAPGVLSDQLQPLTAPALRDASPEEQAAAAGLPADGAGALVHDPQGRLEVLVRVAATDDGTVAAIRGLADVVAVSDRMSRVTVRVDLARLDDLAAVDGVLHVSPSLAPLVVPVGPDGDAGSGGVSARPGDEPGVTTSAITCGNASPVVSEGDEQLRAALARAQHGADGTGVKVGVLSDSYDWSSGAVTRAAQDVASGDLPGPGNPCGRTTPVKVVDEADVDPGDVIDEGRAMAQIVHDLAPGAEILFATAYGGEDKFAENIVALADAGADVIVDDITYFSEPMFQSGVVDQAVTEVVGRGITYFSSAGNSNVTLNGDEARSWEAPAYRPAACPAAVAAVLGSAPDGTCMDFDPGVGVDTTYDIQLSAPAEVLSLRTVLNWAEPHDDVETDLDLYVLSGGSILTASVIDNAVDGRPWEWRALAGPGTLQLVIVRWSGTATPRLKLIHAQGRIADVEHDTSTGGDVVGPTTWGHNAGVDAIGVAATPYDDATTVEDFSSRGPATLYFEPVSAGGSDPLDEPLVIHAPQMSATDGGANTFFGGLSGGVRRFYGTSAAAPHAAAVAALMLERVPGLTPAQVRATLEDTATSLAGVPAAAQGAGLVDAAEALDAIGGSLPKITVPGAPKVTRTVAGPGRATVTFTAGSSGGHPITSHTATCTGQGPTRSATRSGASAAPLVVTGLAPGKKYSCRVQARSAKGAGTVSAAGATVVPTGRATAPRDVKVKAKKKRRAVVRFKAPANLGGLPVDRYTVTCRPVKKGKVRSARGTKRKLVVKKLSKGKRYTCSVVARNALGDSPAATSKRFKAKR